MDGYRRGKEGPMDWEITLDPSAGASSSSSASRLAPSHDNDDAMDITFQDESVRDITMDDVVEGSDDDQPVEGLQKSPPQSAGEEDKIEEIPRADHRQTSSSGGASSSSLLPLIPSKTARRKQRRTRRRRGSHSSFASSAADDEEGGTSLGQWPLAPVVGTVINYLVPPVSTQSATSPSESQAHSHSPYSSRGSAAQRAHTTLHPREKPLLLLSYAQLAFNSSLLLLAGYVLFALVWTIRLDVVERLRDIEDAYHHSITTCQRSHSLNCLIIPLPPALIAACDEWDRCSRKKLTEVLGGSRLRVVIEVLFEAWEAGIGGLGWRTLGFSLVLLTIVVGGANSTLNGLRMGVLRKSRHRKLRHRDAEEEEEEERERRRARREGGAGQTINLPPTSSYPNQQALPPSSPYATVSHHHDYHPYPYRQNSVNTVSSPPLTPSSKSILMGKKVGGRRIVLESPSRFGNRSRGSTSLGNGEVVDEWVDDT